MGNRNSRDSIVHVSEFYATAIAVLLSFTPSLFASYLYYFQAQDLRYINLLGHEIAIGIALLQSGFIAWISWRCFLYSGEQFLIWLARGFLGFTIIYACHGIFTRIASDNIWQFVLYGPVSRLAMMSCFFAGLIKFGQPDIAPHRRAGRWPALIALFVVVNIVVFNLAATEWAARLQRGLEIAAVVVSLLCIGIVLWRRISSPLMNIFTVSLLFFAQSSLTFLVSRPWNHIWWLAHIIFAVGFLILSYGVIRVFLTTRSFSLIFSQDELMRRISVEKERAQEALGKLQSAHQELGDTHDLLQSVLASASEFSIIATNTEGVITMFNAGSERMLGYQASELVGRHTPALLHAPEEVEARGKELSEEFGRSITGFSVFVVKPERDGKESREWTYIHKDGHRLPVILVVTAMRSTSGQITGYLGIAENIEERKRLENIKSEFLATVSHELRTPLTAISGSIDLISSGALGAVTPPFAEMLDVASRNVQRLKLLIDDLLDIEKISAGKLNFDFEWQALLPLVTQSIDALRHYGSEKQISFVFDCGDCCDVEVNVDGSRLQQVLANLLSNAVKFSPTGARVEVFLSVVADRARVEIVDHGSGVPTSFRSQVFQRFSQADSSTTRAQCGSGLGLAISRELIEHMDGWIGFESVLGEGAVFWFELPLKKHEPTAAQGT